MTLLFVNLSVCSAGELFLYFKDLFRFKQAVFGARFRKDGRLVAIGGEEGKLRVFDVDSASGTGKAPLRSVKASTQSLKIVEFAHNGKSVFSMADDGKIRQWDLADTGYFLLLFRKTDLDQHISWKSQLTLMQFVQA